MATDAGSLEVFDATSWKCRIGDLAGIGNTGARSDQLGDSRAT